jgi:hypothetical protein
VRCYYVLIHGKLDWQAEVPGAPDAENRRPAGFYCHRYVLAEDERSAAENAFQRVRANLDKQQGWLSAGAAVLKLEADEVNSAPMHKLLKPQSRGYTFYREAE